MTKKEVMEELESYGSEQTRKIYTNHGADLEQFGVSMANLKKLFKKVKKNHELGFELLFSGNIDAMYMSKWMIDSSKLTRHQLEEILLSTTYYMIIDSIVAYLAAKDTALGLDCLHHWIDHDDKRFRQSAYSLFGLILMSYSDELIDTNLVKIKLEHVKENIHNEENRVRYSMNGFLISAGIYLSQFTDTCKEYASDIGKVTVYMGKTSCKVPDALPYIEKVEKMNKIGFKRKL